MLADELEEEIATRELTVDDHLGTKDELRRRWSVAPTTLNEAIRLLEQRGRVRVRPGPGGGVFVMRPSAAIRLDHLLLGTRRSAEVAHALQVRNALEPVVAAQAAVHRTDVDVAEIEFLLGRMSALASDPPSYLEANWVLHRRIAATIPNPLLGALYATLLDFAEAEIDGVAASSTFPIEANLVLHRTLVAAIVAGDATEAERLGRVHADALDLDAGSADVDGA